MTAVTCRVGVDASKSVAVSSAVKPPFMRQLLKLISKADNRKSWHGVIVTRGGAVVSASNNHSARHAEVNALNKLWPSERRGCTVISVRLMRSGEFSMSRPCPSCEAYLKENGVSTVIYTDWDGNLVRERF